MKTKLPSEIFMDVALEQEKTELRCCLWKSDSFTEAWMETEMRKFKNWFVKIKQSEQALISRAEHAESELEKIRDILKASENERQKISKCPCHGEDSPHGCDCQPGDEQPCMACFSANESAANRAENEERVF